MAIVETIFVRLRTRDAPKAGTDASVYVGIGGREFRIDSRDPDFDDFERNDDRTYILGKEPNTLPSPNPEYIGRSFIGMGDPDTPYVIKTENLPLFPVYVRVNVGSGSQWLLDFVEIRANPEADDITYWALADPDEFIVLGKEGYMLYLLPKIIDHR
jgi:hypothetical protein